MSGSALLVLEVLFYVATAASVVGWIWLIRRRLTTGNALVAPRSRPEPFWSLAEFFLMFGLLLICTAAAASTARKYWGPEGQDAPEAVVTAKDSPEPTIESMIATAVALAVCNLVVLAAVISFMGLTRRHELDRYGLWPSGDDVRLGAAASVLILPPVLILATLLEYLVPYEHQVFNLIEQRPEPAVFWAMALSALLVAPVFEEFMFRTLLQGGGQRVIRRTERLRDKETVSDKELQSLEKSLQWITSEEVPTWSWWPVVIASLTFATLHLGQGAAPIALFFFSLALGYLYRQTGRLWPCIFVHLALNSVSLLGFILQVLSKGMS